jgi:hypothetical protein
LNRRFVLPAFNVRLALDLCETQCFGQRWMTPPHEQRLAKATAFGFDDLWRHAAADERMSKSRSNPVSQPGNRVDPGDQRQAGLHLDRNK